MENMERLMKAEDKSQRIICPFENCSWSEKIKQRNSRENRVKTHSAGEADRRDYFHQERSKSLSTRLKFLFEALIVNDIKGDELPWVVEASVQARLLNY